MFVFYDYRIFISIKFVCHYEYEGEILSISINLYIDF